MNENLLLMLREIFKPLAFIGFKVIALTKNTIKLECFQNNKVVKVFLIDKDSMSYESLASVASEINSYFNMEIVAIKKHYAFKRG